MIQLYRPTIELKEQAIDYKNEHFSKGERVINGSELWDRTERYEEWLENISKNASPDTVSRDWVVTDTFFAVRKEDSKVADIYQIKLC